ncbi:MAG: hypothetical protein AB8C84_10470 [Oligoflexales bacterium]
MQKLYFSLIFIFFIFSSCSTRKKSNNPSKTIIPEYIQQKKQTSTTGQTSSTANSIGSQSTGQQSPSQNSSSTSTPSAQASTCSSKETDLRDDCVSSDTIAIANKVLEIIDTSNTINQMNTNILTSITPTNTRIESTVYRWADFLEAYKVIAIEGIDGKVFSPGKQTKSGLINIAIFLGQSMHETIQYNACDENNWSIGLGYPDYPATASCGQAGQDYSAYNCTATEEHMQCPVNSQMEQQASTMATWYGAPPPLFCAPKSKTGENLPRWNAYATCTPDSSIAADLPNWINDNIKNIENPSCQAYPGQQGGAFTLAGCDATGCKNAETMDTAGGEIRTDVEGCCWWGRGVIQTTGVCNFGKLNYYLAGWEYRDNGAGQRIKKQHNPNAKYASMNICEDPNSICQGPKELKWIAGMFYWIDSVQGYSSKDYPDFNYLKILEGNAEAIFDDPTGPEAKSLVDSTSGLVNRGCPLATCPGSGAVLKLGERYENFQHVMEVLKPLYAELKN